MKTKKINRAGHAGKSLQEKEAYRRFLSSKFELDKTESDPIDTDKTNESSYDEDETPEIAKSQKKSFKLVVKDFINNNWFITIVGGIIVAVVIGLGGFLIKINVSQEIHSEKINNIEKDIETLKNVDDGNKNSFFEIKQNFEIFKVEITKDLEFIKKKIKF